MVVARELGLLPILIKGVLRNLTLLTCHPACGLLPIAVAVRACLEALRRIYYAESAAWLSMVQACSCRPLELHSGQSCRGQQLQCQEGPSRCCHPSAAGRTLRQRETSSPRLRS